MNTKYLILTILYMALATFATRFLPLLWVNKKSIHPYLKIWLSYIPMTIFSALLSATLFTEVKSFGLSNQVILMLFACLIAAILTFKTKSVGWGMMGSLCIFGTISFFLN